MPGSSTTQVIQCDIIGDPHPHGNRMVLREFGLTTVANDNRRREFELQTRCITAMYERLFPKYHVESSWKLLINCSPVGESPSINEALGVATVTINASIDDFFELPDPKKKVWAVDRLMLGTDHIVKVRDWDPQPFVSAYDAMREAGYVNLWIWRKHVSPSKKMQAIVTVTHDVRDVTLSLSIVDPAGKQLAQTDLKCQPPDEWHYAQFLGELRWEWPTRVSLLSVNGESVRSLEVS